MPRAWGVPYLGHVSRGGVRHHLQQLLKVVAGQVVVRHQHLQLAAVAQGLR